MDDKKKRKKFTQKFHSRVGNLLGSLQPIPDKDLKNLEKYGASNETLKGLKSINKQLKKPKEQILLPKR